MLLKQTMKVEKKKETPCFIITNSKNNFNSLILNEKICKTELSWNSLAHFKSRKITKL